MKTKTAPTPDYVQPAYVGAFMLTAVGCVMGGVILIIVGIVQGTQPWYAIGLFLAALVNFLYGCIADDIARSKWQTERLAWDLRGVIDEIELQASERVQRDRLARQKREAEARLAANLRQSREERADATARDD